MTEADLARIEGTLGVRLPDDYRQFTLAYPFAPDSFANDCEIPDDVERLIDVDLGSRGTMGLLLWGAALVVVLIAADRLLLWMESCGC